MTKHPLYHTIGDHSYHLDPLPKGCIIECPPLLKEKEKMGVVILAGGQGSRLGLIGPKGCVKLPVRGNPTLFEYILKKVPQKNFPIALMTSPHNHKETVSFFEKYHYFGLTNIAIFQQSSIAVSDEDGHFIYDEKGKKIKAPEGNGKAFFHLKKSGIIDQWDKEGVKTVQWMFIDNPLITPFDEELLAIHQDFHVELVVKCIRKKEAQEKVGTLGIRNGKLIISEYFESEQCLAQFPFGNMGVFSSTLDFIKRVSQVKLPWHISRKKVNGNWVLKFENFIIDLFPYSNSFKVLIGDRNKCFSPIKNSLGSDSIESAAKALMTFNPEIGYY